jgi:hypothetical protein
MLEEVNHPEGTELIEKWELGGDLTEKFVSAVPFEFLPHP